MNSVNWRGSPVSTLWGLCNLGSGLDYELARFRCSGNQTRQPVLSWERALGGQILARPLTGCGCQHRHPMAYSTGLQLSAMLPVFHHWTHNITSGFGMQNEIRPLKASQTCSPLALSLYYNLWIPSFSSLLKSLYQSKLDFGFAALFALYLDSNQICSAQLLIGLTYYTINDSSKPLLSVPFLLPAFKPWAIFQSRHLPVLRH